MDEGLWRQLTPLDATEVARRAACEYDPDRGHYVINLLDKTYEVYPATEEIRLGGTETGEPNFMAQLCILSYLINAKELALAGKLIQGRGLPGGDFFFRGVHSLPTAELEETFGDCPEKFREAAVSLGGTMGKYGDASAVFTPLPRVPITMIVWGKDEEFEARASILFDETVGKHLPLDALLALVGLLVAEVQQEAEGTRDKG